MNRFLYPCFKNWIGSIWFISDTHFGDLECYKKRFPAEFDFAGCEQRPTDEWIIEYLNNKLISNINKKVSRKDTLVILGDIGDLDCIKRLKAGYKVLIKGNHDSGISNYKRIKTKIADSYYLCNICGHEVYPDFRDFYNCGYDEAYCIHCKKTQKIKYYDTKYEDNKLFDEIYTGCLMIRDNLILSHEPVDFQFALNIHGHDHNGTDFKKYVLKEYDSDMISNDMIKNYLEVIKDNNLKKFNVCAEWIGYSPVLLKDIIKSGALKNIEDIHRLAIDKANAHK